MNKTAQDKTLELRRRIYLATGDLGYAPVVEKDAETLRRAELTLTSWAEEVCNGTIERPWEGTVDGPDTYVGNRPARSIGGYRDSSGRFHTEFMFVPDREAGALRRVAEVCKRNGLEFFHQGDPRGCTLYIARQGQGMNDTNYSSFVPCYVSFVK